MSRVLVTGGTGVLGRELRPRLLAAGYTVRVMSRREPRPGEAAGIEWAVAQLSVGDGLAEALADVDVIIHAASNPTKRQVDVDGTRFLLRAAEAAGVSHFIYISIVGIDHIPFAYYKNKLAAERLIESSCLPWTILRATQFHYLIDVLIGALTKLPLAVLPTDFQFQTISAAEVADRLVEAVEAGPSGRLVDIGGPQVMRLDEMARLWLKVRGRRRWLVRLPLPGKVAAGFRKGRNTTSENRRGLLTWSEWLEARYGYEAPNSDRKRADSAASKEVLA